MFSVSDTIAAIATPPGRGGIGIVRLSGPDAHAIARRLITHDAPLEPRHATLTRVVSARLKPGPTYAAPTATEPRAAAPTTAEPCVGHRFSGASETGASRDPIDQAVATFFPAPHSYTGDDVVELSAHGSPVVLHAIVA